MEDTQRWGMDIGRWMYGNGAKAGVGGQLPVEYRICCGEGQRQNRCCANTVYLLVRIFQLVHFQLVVAAAALAFLHATFAALILVATVQFHPGHLAHAIMHFQYHARRNDEVQ